ncbi:MAG: hypothetical protein SV062_13640 [Thermodesulfobacteriota bacterium]|nr:hypothetical protein [Thermodesulfobacteriota bacterium]
MGSKLAKIWNISKLWIYFLIFFFSGVIFLFEAYTLILFYTERCASLPENFGNFNLVRVLLKDDGKREENNKNQKFTAKEYL